MLGDEEKRARYDRLGDVPGDLPFGDSADLAKVTEFFDAIFGDLFGLGRKRAAGQDLRYTLELDFDEAALGCQKTIRFQRNEDCRSCGGTGAQGGAAGLQPCARCAGQGWTRHKAGFFSARRDCLACAGSGQIPSVRCPTCSGTGLCEREREYVVRVPPGSQAGGTQRVAGEGSPGRRGGPAGDLHVMVRPRPHPFYRQQGDLLEVEVPVRMDEAALGTEIEVPLLDARVRMKIPAGTQPGSVFRVRGKGLPCARAGRSAQRVQRRSARAAEQVGRNARRACLSPPARFPADDGGHRAGGRRVTLLRDWGTGKLASALGGDAAVRESMTAMAASPSLEYASRTVRAYLR